MEAQYIIPVVLTVVTAFVAGGYIWGFAKMGKKRRELSEGLLPAREKIPYLKVENGDVSLEEAVNNAPAPKGI